MKEIGKLKKLHPWVVTVIIVNNHERWIRFSPVSWKIFICWLSEVWPQGHPDRPFCNPPRFSPSQSIMKNLWVTHHFKQATMADTEASRCEQSQLCSGKGCSAPGQSTGPALSCTNWGYKYARKKRLRVRVRSRGWLKRQASQSQGRASAPNHTSGTLLSGIWNI